MTTLGRRTPATPEHAGCVSGGFSYQQQRNRKPCAPGMRKEGRRYGATPQARGAHWLHLRERRPPARRLP